MPTKNYEALSKELQELVRAENDAAVSERLRSMPCTELLDYALHLVKGVRRRFDELFESNTIKKEGNTDATTPVP